MRFSHSPVDAAILITLILPFLTAAINLDCTHPRADKVSWDLSALGGPKSVLHSDDEGASWEKTTYTIDICKPLKRDDKVPEQEKCPGNTRICAIERIVAHDRDSEILRRAWPIAGDLKEKGGANMDPVWTRLKTSESSHDSQQEGVRLTFGGGFWTDPSTKKKRYQKAIIEFICDKDLEGDENLWNPEDKYEKREENDREKDGDKNGEVDTPILKNASSLQFVSYITGDDADVLRLTWRTKHACEGAKDEKDAEIGNSWGFFTWFILIAFLSTATYLIFGSWLNYNRYGARGWDLLPHGDTIRDVPYLLKDWTRRVLNTLQGSGTRGGYAAV